MKKKAVFKKIILPILLLVVVVSAAIIFSVTKKEKTNPPIVSVVNQENKPDIEKEINQAVINRNVHVDFNGNYEYLTIRDVSFSKEVSEEVEKLTYKYLTGSTNNNAARLYFHQQKLNLKDEYLTILNGHYTKTIDSNKVEEGIYYGNLDKSYIYIENDEGKIDIDGTKYNIGLEISQTGYWLNANIVPSNSIIYVREKFFINELSDNFLYITYVYKLVEL